MTKNRTLAVAGFVAAATFVFAPLHGSVAGAEPTAGTEAKTEQPPAEKEQPDKLAQDSFDLLMTAIEANDYAGFALALDDNAKAALNKEKFEQVTAQLVPRLEKGYESFYVGSLKRKDGKVYLWKMVFKNDGDEILAYLSITNDKISGFLLL